MLYYFVADSVFFCAQVYPDNISPHPPVVSLFLVCLYTALCIYTLSLSRSISINLQERAPHGDSGGNGGRQLRHRGGGGVEVRVEMDIDEIDPTLNYGGNDDDHHGHDRDLLSFAQGGTDDFSRELVVARLQQKLDKIERDYCSTMILDGTFA